MNSRLVLLAFLALSTLGIVPALAAPPRASARSPILVQVQVHEMGEQIKLVLDWKGQVNSHVRSALSGQNKMVISLSPAHLKGGNQRFPVRRGLIGVVEAVQANATTVRITIPVMAPPAFNASSRGPAGGLQFFISTMEVDRGTPSAAVPSPVASPAPAPAAPSPVASPSPAPAPPAPVASPSPAPAPPAPVASPSPAPAPPAPVASPSPAPAPPVPVASPPPAPAVPAPVASSGSQALPSRSYSMVLTGQDLAEVLENLAEDLGLRPVLDPAVKGPVFTTIADLDAASALEAILRTQKTRFAFEVSDGQLRVFPAPRRPGTAEPVTPAVAPAPKQVPAPALTQGASARAQAFFPIQGRKAGAVAEGLQALYPQVVFQVDEMLNVILVEGNLSEVEQIRKVLNVFAQP